jgi:NADPH2:quinone reductase
VFDYVATNALLAERAQRVWDGLANGNLIGKNGGNTRHPPIERHALAAAAQAHARLESRATIGALILMA